MKVKVMYLSEYGYACISEGNRNMDVRLEPGRSAEKSLRESANEMRVKAAQMMERAGLIERAANHLEAEKAK